MKNVKTLFKVFGFGLILTSLFAGCGMDISDGSKDSGSGYGSIVVNSADRAIDVSTIKYARVFVSGDEITDGNEPCSDWVNVKAGRTSEIVIDNIPEGKNRIVTVYGYDSGKVVMQPVVIRAIANVTGGQKVSVSVNKDTTALANVFDYLNKAGVSVADINLSEISAVIDSTKHYALIASDKIASDYTKKALKSSSAYVLEPATLAYKSNYSEPVTIQVFDRTSEVKTNVSGEGTLTGIAPGTYKVAVIKDGNEVYSTVKTFEAGKTTDVVEFGKVTVSGKIIFHVYNYTHIWAWNPDNASENYTGGNWPGKAMTQEGSSKWYTYTIEKAKTAVIFNNNGGSQTDDLTQEEGEWWFKDGKFYDSDPNDATAPVLVSFTADKSGTVTGTITFTVEATDNLSLGKAVVTIDGATKDVALSGTSASGTLSVDTNTLANGSHSVTCVVFDGAGNLSNQKSLSFSTKNAPKAVINGAGAARYGSDVTFTYGGSSSVTAYSWKVTGATIKSGAGTNTIIVSAPSSGTSFTVALTVTNEVGSDSTSKSVNLTDGATGDFRDESIYFLMTTRFYDGDTGNNEYCWDEGGEYLKFGDGDCAWRGDFKGLIQKLDYIKALGFSAIWITPVVVNASGIDYHGYHAFDFSHVDPRYATAAQQAIDLETAGDTAYQELIDACHSKGIKVIQDIVLNHSGNFGEKNIFPMFEKDTTPYVNKDVPVPAGGKRSPFMKVGGSYTDKLMKGLATYGTQDYDNAIGAWQYGARINAMKEDSIDTDKIYHHCKTIDWNSENCQLGQMAGDCVDLNTENPTVFNYLKDCYVNYINMGVDAFRIDTVKHISRLTFNKEFIPAFMEAGGDSFYIFGETCARYRGRWNEGVPALSPSFYTWKEDSSFAWSSTDADANSASATAHFTKYRSGFEHPAWKDGVANHLLKGNDYHTPDYSMRSHLDQIDFPMHWAFSNANDAFGTAVNTNDPDFNDATWNVVYVDSHDYAPDNAPESQRYSKTEEWPRNMNLMFTFRGIPCIYYGSEVMFKAGMPIDPANTRTTLDGSGRAYFGDYLEGNVTASDFCEYTASGTVAETLNHELAQHVIRLNKIRRSIAALRKGQYSTQGCSGSIAFKRRYTDSTVDSFALVAVGGKATFSGIPSGQYIEVITGKTVSSTGSLTTDEIGQDNMRVYVLKTSTCEVSGKIGKDGAYLK